MRLKAKVHTRRNILDLALLISIGAASGCDLLDNTHEYVVRVETISAPSTIAAGTPLEIGFHGFIGYDGCSRLSKIGKESRPDRLSITFVAERSRGECTQMPVPLNHSETVMPPLQSPFTITAFQPSGSPLVHVVHVQPDAVP